MSHTDPPDDEPAGAAHTHERMCLICGCRPSQPCLPTCRWPEPHYAPAEASVTLCPDCIGAEMLRFISAVGRHREKPLRIELTVGQLLGVVGLVQQARRDRIVQAIEDQGASVGADFVAQAIEMLRSLDADLVLGLPDRPPAKPPSGPSALGSEFLSLLAALTKLRAMRGAPRELVEGLDALVAAMPTDRGLEGLVSRENLAAVRHCLVRSTWRASALPPEVRAELDACILRARGLLRTLDDEQAAQTQASGA